MKKQIISKFVLLAALLTSIFTASCSSSGDGSAKLETGDYKYTLWNADNKMVAEGKFVIASIKGEAVTGTHKITVLYDSTFAEAVTLKKGTFSGKYTASTNDLGINMNPMMADNNIYFTGKFNNGTIDGSWSHSTMMGQIAKGKLKAVLQ